MEIGLIDKELFCDILIEDIEALWRVINILTLDEGADEKIDEVVDYLKGLADGVAFTEYIAREWKTNLKGE